MPPGLEPTYEGLKRCSALYQLTDGSSLEPTYEGLKRLAPEVLTEQVTRFGASLGGIKTHAGGPWQQALAGVGSRRVGD